MADLRAMLFLVRLSFVRQACSRKLVLAALLMLLACVMVLVVGVRRGWDMKSFGDWVVLRLFFLVLLPIACLTLGGGALGDEREDGSLVYLLSRPLSRFAIYLGKWCAAAPLALLFGLGGLFLLGAAAARGGPLGATEAWNVFWRPAFLGTLTYLALFHLLAAVFRHATLIALAYVFFVEVFLGRAPGILKRVSISFYTWSMLYEDAESFGIEPRPRAVFLPMDGDTSSCVLVGATLALLVIGAKLFSSREYRA